MFYFQIIEIRITNKKSEIFFFMLSLNLKGPVGLSDHDQKPDTYLLAQA